MFDFRKIGLAAVMSVGLAGTAHAAPMFTLGGGSASEINSNFAWGEVNFNSGVVPIYGSSPQAGYLSATLGLTGGPANIKVDLLGSEAGFTNAFNLAGTVVSTGGNTHNGGNGVWGSLGSPIASTTVFGASAADVSGFRFTSSGGTAAGNGDRDVFFRFVSDQVVDLWYDDEDLRKDGWFQDDNHDDMAVRLTITAVPLPAAGLLLLGGIAGLGFASRKRKAA